MIRRMGVKENTPHSFELPVKLNQSLNQFTYFCVTSIWFMSRNIINHCIQDTRDPVIVSFKANPFTFSQNLANVYATF